TASTLGFIAYRAPEQVSAYDLRDPLNAKKNPDGYFQATAIYNEAHRNASDWTHGNIKDENSKARHLILLLDNSLSMNGDKITRAYEAIDTFLHKLSARDSFNIILFNETPSPFANQLQSATPANVENGLAFIREAPLAGGTEVLAALKLALTQAE